tara:strand:- start:259 stop:651 length:393 start_codon:yes stop_codon:yes gene_type:complete
MKIGTSLSRCVRDIFDKRVNMNDIMVIVARTNFDPEDDTQWHSIWNGYTDQTGIGSYPEWIFYRDHEQEFRQICLDLKKHGKLHQPRQYGAFVIRHDEYWYDAVLTAETHQDKPGVKKAWDNYKLIAGLA